MNQEQHRTISVKSFSEVAIPHLVRIIEANIAVMDRLVEQIFTDVKAGRSLLVFGSGHSGIFPMELYHRAGGPSFVIPVVADYLLPTAGPTVVRVLERTPGAANAVLNRVEPQAGEMIWLCSQSGINSAIIDLALECKARGLRTVAFTSKVHSLSGPSRHASGKRLFEVCDETVDLGGVAGDAAVKLNDDTRAGPLSSLGAIMLAHSIIVSACAKLEQAGVRCVYTSVNTPDGESRNKKLEEIAKKRDYLLR